MRIFIGVILIILCTGFGYILSNKYSERKEYFICFSDFNQKLLNEVMFLSETINSVIDKEKESAFKNSVINVLVKKKEFTRLKFLSDDENDYLKDYINIIGKNDKKTESAILRDYEIKLNKMREKAIKDSEKYRKTYVKIGFLIGLMLMIAIL